MALTLWRPTRDLLNIQDEMDRMLDRFFGTGLLEDGFNWYPPVDITESNNEFVVKAELPGMKRDDIHVTYKNGLLTIEGERNKENQVKEANYHRIERQYGKFCRTFQLPSEIQEDKIDAVYKDGILSIRLPKAEKARAKEISVKVA